jgi:hypothetical protein
LEDRSIEKDNIKMDLKTKEYDSVGCIHLTLHRAQWRAFVNTNEPAGSVKCGEFLDYLSCCEVLKDLVV